MGARQTLFVPWVSRFRCEALFFWPSGIHDNAVIQSASHLLPFTLPEKTITGCDGPLSVDEAHSHFLDGCVSACVSVRVYITWPERPYCFITQELHVMVAPFSWSHFEEGLCTVNCLWHLCAHTFYLFIYFFFCVTVLCCSCLTVSCGHTKAYNKSTSSFSQSSLPSFEHVALQAWDARMRAMMSLMC